MQYSNTILGIVLSLVSLVLCMPAVGGTHLSAEPGCTGSGQTQRIELHDGSRLYEVFVPVDSNPYTLEGSLPQLKCIDLSIKDGPCINCEFVIDHIQIKFAGFCDITVHGTDLITRGFILPGGENFALGTSGKIGRIICFPLQSTRKRSTLSGGVTCPETHGSNVTLVSGASTYIMPVPNDTKLFNVVGPFEQLGCIGPLGSKYSQCVPCNFPVQQIEVSEAAGVCGFKITGHKDTVYYSYGSKPPTPLTPGQILSVECGIGNAGLALSKSESSNTVVKRQAPRVECPAWADNTTIKLESIDSAVSSIVKWDLELRPDGTVFELDYPNYNVGCQRRDKYYTDQCFECNFNITTLAVPDEVTCKFKSSNSYRTDEFTIEGPQELSYDMNSAPRLHRVTCHRNNVELQILPTSSNPGQADVGPPSFPCEKPVNISKPSADAPTHHFRFYIPPDQQFYRPEERESPIVGHRVVESGVCVNDRFFPPWQVIAVADGLGECRIQLSSRKDLLTLSAADGPKHIEPRAHITGIECGFGINAPPKAKTLHRKDVENPSMADARTLYDITASSPSVNVPTSTDPNCATDSTWNVVVMNADGNAYAVPAPLDLEAHWMNTMHCIRIADAACVPCNMIGAATGVSTKIKWGPCIFFTEDHRSFFTQYWNASPDHNSNMIPVTAISPGNAISGIECGSGA